MASSVDISRDYKEILDGMLDKVPRSVDKREGSLIYSALAPAAAELAEAYAFLDGYLDLVMPDTAVGEFLDRICSQVGISRKPSQKAKVAGRFYNADQVLIGVELGKKFACGQVIYEVVEALVDGGYGLLCLESGLVGNLTVGELLPMDYVANLAKGEISELLTIGAAAESDEALRARYYVAMSRPAFGGNISDYQSRALSLDGVGAAAVFPVWNGAGTVRLAIGGNDLKAVPPSRVSEVQEFFMPLDSANIGKGFAPIGHNVSVISSSNITINVSATVVLKPDVALGQVQSEIIARVADYINGMAFDDGIIHQSRIAVAILLVEGIADVKNIRINNSTSNYVLSKTATNFQTPIFGTMTLGV